ncbi:MAG TPA: TMEM175 family protein [Solirubrobacterales bacterium]|nr:TMEM175 family protein [Solirubrobacterales bacterium]
MDNEVEFSRIVAFSDGVFSIAITLLVLNLSLEKGLANGEVAGALWDQREHLAAFAISFAVIGRFWVIHHRFFGEVKAFDGRLIALNLFYLAWIVLIPFSSEVLGEYGDATAGVVLYSVNIAAVVLIGVLMATDARRAGLVAWDDSDHAQFLARGGWTAGVFLLSIPLAFLAPGATPLVWLALFVDPGGRMARRAQAG